jgi:D-amino-acid dehydrogenase
MKCDIIVLGAGMVGTATALQLALRGHQVTLIDRRGPGQETSYGNAGLIQREAAEPQPFPRDLATIMRIAAGRGTDVHYHAAALPALARPLATYWHNSEPSRYATISRAYGSLIAKCQEEHLALVTLAQAEDLVRKEGYLHVFRHADKLATAVTRARRLQHEAGVQHAVLDADALERFDPNLRSRMVGAIHWLQTWAVCDPGALVNRYADLLLRTSGRFLPSDASDLQPTETGWRIRTAEGMVEARHAVVALGPWSSALIGTLGYRYPLFPKRGYHRHYRSTAGPRVAVLDAESGFVIAPMRQGVRVTTGAEFARLDARATPVQLQRVERSARSLFELGEPVEAEPWLGARPCSADMLPVIGAAPRHRGLWFNFGHAHQGFTLGPVSGRLLADLIEGRQTVVDASPYSPSRFLR